VTLANTVFWTAFALYVANLALGVSVQLRWVSTKRARWVHHVLYFAVFVGALAAATALLVVGGRWWAFLLTLTCLALLPRFKGGSRIHMALTFSGFLGYVLASTGLAINNI
jgi:hypothetical protein